MQDCLPFNVFIGDSAAAVLTYLRAELARRGGSATGDASGGDFAIPLPIGGSILGSYVAKGSSVAITISHRPAVVSCGMIEAKVHDIILDAKNAVRQAKPGV